MSAKLLDDLLAYVEPEAYSFCIQLFSILQEAEKLEEFFLVFFLYSNTVIDYLDLESSMARLVDDLVEFVVIHVRQIIRVIDVFSLHFDLASLRGELERVRYKVENDLL